jgi:predicted LPLAT superfamily acyltransferase
VIIEAPLSLEGENGGRHAVEGAIENYAAALERYTRRYPDEWNRWDQRMFPA